MVKKAEEVTIFVLIWYFIYFYPVIPSGVTPLKWPGNQGWPDHSREIGSISQTKIDFPKI